MPARLTFYETDLPASQYLLNKGDRYLIGRDESCAISVGDGTLSRRHARLRYRDKAWRLSDLCSKNGTLIGGRPIDHHDLSDGEWVEFGSVLACFDWVSSQALAADEQRIGEQWQSSVQLSRVLTPSMSPDQLLTRVLDSFVAISGSDRGFVMLQAPSGELHPDLSHPPGCGDFTGSRSVVKKTFTENRPVVCSDVSQSAQLGPQPSIATGTISALACVPLRVGEAVLGVIYVDSREAGKHFTALDIEILQALADHAALVMGVSQLRDNIEDLSHLLPTELSRETQADAALIDKVQQLLTRLDRRGAARGVAIVGVDN